MKLGKYLIPICAVVSHAADECRDQLPHCPDLIATCNNEQAGLSESGKKGTTHCTCTGILYFKSASHFVKFVKSRAGIVMQLQATNIQLRRHYHRRLR